MVRLGQNFLADRNLLEAIVREADPAADEVVLEVGGGEGVLSELLATRVRHLHVIEIDRRLRPELERVADRSGAIALHFGDAMKLPLESLQPAPTAVIANLPYAIATPFLIESIRRLPAVARWTVMVQREIAERLRARAGTRSYGAPSVVAQLSCEVRMIRRVNPAVFTPRPRVDSAVLQMQRTGPPPSVVLSQFVRDAFAHRRKALPRSLELAARRREDEAARAGSAAPRPRSGEVRRRALEALAAAGLPPVVRAEALTPEEFRRLGGAYGC